VAKGMKPNNKGGELTEEYFPVVADRLKMKINITHYLTSMVTGPGNRRSYLHRFKIIEIPTYPWHQGQNNRSLVI
jgi:hypothetical protein